MSRDACIESCQRAIAILEAAERDDGVTALDAADRVFVETALSDAVDVIKQLCIELETL